MISPPPIQQSDLRSYINSYIDDDLIPSDPAEAHAYLLLSRHVLAHTIVQCFSYLKHRHLLDDFCRSFTYF